MDIQSLLDKMGYNSGPIDGVFGQQTKQTVEQFQRDYGLTADGIIGSNTTKVLLRFLLGYENYTIKSGDTLSKIAHKYHIKLPLLLTANPGICLLYTSPSPRD